MKRILLLLLVLCLMVSLCGCSRVMLGLFGYGRVFRLELAETDEIADIYHSEEDLFQEAVDALRSTEPFRVLMIDPITRAEFSFYSCEIGELRFTKYSYDASDAELFEKQCAGFYDSVMPLFDDLSLYGIRVGNDNIRFVLESSKGYAAEIFYEYDENTSELSTPRIIDDVLQIDDHWYAVITYEPDVSP